MDYLEHQKQDNKTASVNNNAQELQSTSSIVDQSIDGVKETEWAKKIQESDGVKTEKSWQNDIAKAEKQALKPNKTGIPDDLKAKMEQLSGFDLSNVRVHYNSDKPAEVGALAYTKGMDIYISTGNEKYLEHELWHVIQQIKGEAKATGEINGEKIDTRKDIEDKADQKADEVQNVSLDDTAPTVEPSVPAPIMQQQAVIQRKPSRVKKQAPLFKDIPAKFIPENKEIWPLIKAQVAIYENLGDEDIKKQTASIAKIQELLNKIVYNKAIAQKQLKQEEENNLQVLLSLINAEEKEVKASKGTLTVSDEEASINASDPTISKKISIDDTSGGAFKKDTDIVDSSEKKVDQGKKGKVGVILQKWDDKDSTVKKATYQKITKEDEAKAGKNYQNIKDGYVKKDNIEPTKRVQKNDKVKYQEQGDALESPLFPHPPTMQDIKQGRLGDCYLLAAMASIANKDASHFVKHIKDQGNGKVTVKLYKAANTPINVTINKSTVVTKGNWIGYGGGEDEYASEALWVQMYEKAYVAAGFHGGEGELPVDQMSYGLIEGGSSGVALTHLTGKTDATHVPIQNNSDQIPEELFSVIKTFKDKISQNEYLLLLTILPTLQEMASNVFVSEDLLEGILQKISNDFGTKDKPNIVKLKKETIDIMIKEIQSKELITGALGSGKYTKKEMDLFNNIKEKLEAGKIMTISTKEKIFDDGEEYELGKSGGEPKVKGLAGNHAYSLLDFAPKKPKKGDTLSLKIRNPWGEYGRSYIDPETKEPIDISSGKAWKGAERKADDNGEFWVDLADVMACCSGYNFI
ncbi:C2 family cysteine protease [Aureispira anguillae]|uniref:C2 family cysteine protease n=1 Tax=Aureispira anguillae TaxID=2864201 RepID=A0A915YAU3_9BACT|nr:C2 family cysteine protease [Aureispira anguillae]BDS09676.1 C2 family cysteine protease [Aureispira anguillae]